MAQASTPSETIIIPDASRRCQWTAGDRQCCSPATIAHSWTDHHGAHMILVCEKHAPTGVL